VNLGDISNSHVILILGAPRSGTSWIAKIFDSHPDVLYRHEPDTVLRAETFPWMCTEADVPSFKEEARAYLRKLMDVTTLKSAGSLPIFCKSYRGRRVEQLRSTLIYSLRALDAIPRTRKFTRQIAIPDYFDRLDLSDLRVLIKSVSSRGRAGLFAEALPGAKVIFILRDPFGQVASMLRGVTLGKFEEEVPMGEVLQTPQATEYGLTFDRFKSLPIIERLTWNWAVLNEKAINDLAAVPTARVLRYQDITADPIGTSQLLFEFVGLAWHPQAEAFIRRSTTYNGRERYYNVLKNTTAAMNRWRSELTPDDQRRIRAIVQRTALKSFFPEVAD
jgi:hypothetical protein